MKYAIITVTKNGADLACKLQNTLKTCDIYVKKDRYDISLTGHIHEYEKMSEVIKNIFAEYEAIIFFTSTGIAVRMIAPFIVHKVKDPAVIVLDEKANFAISLLSGHLGGANELTLKIADILNAIPVITTATDTNKIIAPDVVARKYNLVPYPLEHIKIINSALIQQQKVIYKEEIRILTMCKAKIRPDNIIWDIGAGTGSLSIEAALLAPQGEVYAIEKKDLAVDLLHQNIAKFKLEDKVKVVATEAPKGLDELPNCDVVFIGGSGKHMFEILDIIDSKLNEGGRIIVNAVTIQTISEITTYMKQKENYTYEAIQIQVNRLRQIGSYDMFNAQNPVYIVTCKKLK